MQKYSALSLFRHALKNHERWRPAWRKAEPQPSYDVVIVGAGGHGLATAWFLARRRRAGRIAVIDQGALGLGNAARNTTIIRSNYLHPESIALYELSRTLYERLSTRLNFNVMFSPRGFVQLCQRREELELYSRITAAMRVRGVDARMLSAEETARLVPLLEAGPDRRFPVLGAFYQPRGGVARHDAVAWAFARAADARGVDIVEHCEATALIVEGGAVKGVETGRGPIRAQKVALTAAGGSRALAATAGVHLPLELACLQAFVTEPVKPVLGPVVVGGTPLVYVSQSDKGELVVGGAAESWPNENRRGSWPAIEEAAAALLELFPSLSRLKLLRSWSGTVDLTPDLSPILGPTPVKGLYVSCGWGTGGFKAIPGAGLVFAATIARDAPHPLAAPFGLERFETGRLIDESTGAALAH